MKHQISTWHRRFQVEHLNKHTVIVLTRKTGHDGDSMWDDRESKRKTKCPLPLKETEIKTTRNDLHRYIVGEKIDTSRIEVRKKKKNWSEEIQGATLVPKPVSHLAETFMCFTATVIVTQVVVTLFLWKGDWQMRKFRGAICSRFQIAGDGTMIKPLSLVPKPVLSSAPLYIN